MKIKALFILLLLILLTACGATGSTAPQSIPEDEALQLPEEIDVQTAAAVQNRPDVVMIDVREPSEYNEGHIPNIILIPMGQIEQRLDEIPKDKEVILTCRSGNRSGQVTELLQQKGFDNVHNMQGGIVAWQKAGYTVEQ